jgi:drug/metabolite transporter (DMT)-like permease
MTPRTTGILGMVAATIVIVWCGVLIATPPFSILGAVGVVGGGILFAIAASLTARKSWGKSNWPEMKVRAPVVRNESVPQQIAGSLCAGGVAFAAVGAWRVITGSPEEWARIAVGLVVAALAFLALIWIIKKERSS